MRLLRLFLDVAALRNISKAAELNGVTQSAVSQRMCSLETDLGVTLLDRSTRPLSLTPAGSLFEAEAREIVDHYQRLRLRVANLEEPPSGEVRVDAIYSAGIDLMHQLRENFQERHSEVSVHLNYRRPEEVDAAVREGACDLGIVSYPRRWQGLAITPLRDERMTAVCAPHHELAGTAVIQADRLEDWAMIGFGADLPVGRHLRRYLKGVGVEPRFVYEPDNIDTLKSMLTVGDAIAILPRRTVLRDVEAGTLSTIVLEPELSRPIGIIYRRKPKLSAASRAFLEFLLENARPDASSLEPEPASLAH